MKLSDLLQAVPVLRISDVSADPEITSIHYRSQDVRPGGLFIAVPGFRADGHDFIADAVNRGAAAVIAGKTVNISGAVVVEVADTRRAMGLLAARFYGNPSDNLCLIGITGTNGKTTTSFLVESVLKQAGFATGVIGTIGYYYKGKAFDNPVTTPESPDLQRILAQMREAGVTHVVMEVSSHAVDLHRIAGCCFDAGIFTNLTQDHLDYHRTLDEYWACKQRFFTEYLAAGPKKDQSFAVVNGNDPRGRQLSECLDIPCLTVGDFGENMIWTENFGYGPHGMSGNIHTPSGVFFVRSPLIGTYNLENILCAVGIGTGLNLLPENIRAGIESLPCVAGRLEPVFASGLSGGKPEIAVYVDYAHTPDALENVLRTVRPLTAGRLVCVFGCGGDRDAGKRPLMGEIAGRMAELAIVTSDNPRTEDPDAIIRDILPGILKTGGQAYPVSDISAGFDGRGHVVEPDRRQAIRLAIRAARPGDIVVIAGKGHENYQIIGRETFPFDDRLEAGKALEIYGQTALDN